MWEKSDKRAENRGETRKLQKNNQAAVRVGDSQITLPWIMKMRRWPGFLLVFWKLENTTCILPQLCFLIMIVPFEDLFLCYVLLWDCHMLWYGLIQHCVHFRLNICSIYCVFFSYSPVCFPRTSWLHFCCHITVFHLSTISTILLYEHVISQHVSSIAFRKCTPQSETHQ